MKQDIERQKKVGVPAFLMTESANSSLGSLPRGKIVVKKDVAVMTSPARDGDFQIGARPPTKEISPKLLVEGMTRLQAKNAELYQRKTAAPDGKQTSGVATGEGVVQADTGNAGFNNQGLLNPTNRIQVGKI